MAVTIKSEKQIALMRESCRRLALVHDALQRELRPGMSTLDIDRIGEELIRSFGCVPNFKNYNGYPASICVSIRLAGQRDGKNIWEDEKKAIPNKELKGMVEFYKAAGRDFRPRGSGPEL